MPSERGSLVNYLLQAFLLRYQEELRKRASICNEIREVPGGVVNVTKTEQRMYDRAHGQWVLAESIEE